MAKLNSHKTYALIQKGKVHSIFKGKDLPEYNEKDLHIVEAGSSWKIGDEYVNGKIKHVTEPSPDLEAVRRDLIGTFAARRDNHIGQAEIEFKGHKFSTEPATYNYFVAASAFFSFTGHFPDDFFWFDINNQKVSMTKSEMKEFVGLLLNVAMQSYTKYAEVQSQITTAASIEGLMEIKWV